MISLLMILVPQLLEVNGVSMRGKSVHEVCQVLGGLAGTLSVVLAPRPRPRPPPAYRVLHVRAHFDYDPEDDVYIPCRELGECAQVYLSKTTKLIYTKSVCDSDILMYGCIDVCYSLKQNYFIHFDQT